jgi:hypothetical protein
MFYSDYKVRFSILYGEPWTEEKRLAAIAEEKERGREWAEDDFPPGYQPYHVGWSCYRDSYQRYPEDDEWALCDSWSGKKIVRPSYDERMATKLKIRISGKRGKNGKLRAHRWSATVKLHNYQVEVARQQPCKSVRDALRRADLLDIDAACEEVVRKGYSRAGAKCIYKKEGDEWVPHLTALPVKYFDYMQLPGGHYFEVRWEQNWREDYRWEVKETSIDRSWGGYGASSGPRAREESGADVEPWLPKPQEDPPPKSSLASAFA